jgi:nucleoside-diphosphate-sugar epimerase
MRLLVTGATGFVGSELLSRAATDGKLQLRGTVRRQAALPAGVEAARVGDLAPDTDWSHALQGVDVIVHAAARVHVMRDIAADPLAEFRRVNVEGTLNLARQAIAAGVRRFVFVSSIKVNGESTSGEQRFSERDRPAPQDPYGVSKWEAEQGLRELAQEGGLEVVIVRTPLVYGSGVKGNFVQMLNVVAKGMPLPFASVHNQRSLIYLGNLVDALLVCATHPAAVGKTYLVRDGEDVSTPELLRLLAEAMGVPSRLFSCPPALLRLAGKLAGRSQQVERLLGSLRVDDAKMRADLNWVPPHALRQGLQATVEWYKKNRT